MRALDVSIGEPGNAKVRGGLRSRSPSVQGSWRDPKGAQGLVAKETPGGEEAVKRQFVRTEVPCRRCGLGGNQRGGAAMRRVRAY